MLISPVLAGTLHAGVSWTLLPLVATWLVGYCAFFAGSLWLKSRCAARYLPALRTYAIASLALGVVVLALQPALARWLVVFVPLIVIGAQQAWVRHDRSLISGAATVTAAALFTFVVVEAVGDPLTRDVTVLALAQLAFLFGTVLYVKTMIRQRGSRAHYVASLSWHTGWLIAAALTSWPLAVVACVLLVRAAWFPHRRTNGKPMTPKQVGLVEMPFHVAVIVSALVS